MKTLIHWAGDAHADAISLTAYAFDANGDLTDAQHVKNSQVTLDVAERGARVFIAPEGRVGQRKLTIGELEKLRAYEPALRVMPGRERLEIAPIPSELIHLWPLPFCRIRGRVVKQIGFFGFHLTLPVCRARVHVCEVDPLIFILNRLPDGLIHRLRDDLLEQLSKIRFPIPLPDPPPGPLAIAGSLDWQVAAGPVDPVPWRGSGRAIDAALSARVQPGAAVALNPQPLPPKALALRSNNGSARAISLPAADLARLSSRSALTVRDALVDNLVLIYPILCTLPWFWPWLRCDEVRVVETDDQGRFDTFMFYPPKGDVPDLYFWVEYFINGTWQTVYRPSIHCYTHWNYVCGSEVTITLTDPRVPGCFPRPPIASSLLVYGIGNIPVEGIDNAGFAEGGNGGDYAPVTQRPFANVLDLQADFPIKSVLAAKSITHFLWSYRRQGGSEGDWVALTTPFSRGYRVDFADDTHLSKLYPINTDPSGRFPIPSEEPWIDLDGGIGGDWEHGHLLTAQVDTNAFPKRTTVGDDGASSTDNDASGEFEFKLELFKSDGTRVDFTADALGIQVQDIDHPLMDGTIPWKLVDPENRYLAGGLHLMGFRMPTVIDNNRCDAQIFEAKVGTTFAGACGFIHYAPGDSVELAYRVQHLTQRATFAFDIFRGSVGVIEYCRNHSGDAIAVANKAAVEPAATSNYVRSAYRFVRLAAVTEMLNACPQGAFGEQLYVAAIATDGYTRAYWLDKAASPMAFALAPEPVLGPVPL